MQVADDTTSSPSGSKTAVIVVVAVMVVVAGLSYAVFNWAHQSVVSAREYSQGTRRLLDEAEKAGFIALPQAVAQSYQLSKNMSTFFRPQTIVTKSSALKSLRKCRTGIREVIAQQEQLSPPDSVKKYHELQLESYRLYLQAVEKYLLYVAKNDPKSMKQGDALLKKCRSKMTEAAQAIGK